MRLTAQVLRTLTFGLLYPFGVYIALKFLLQLGYGKYTAAGLSYSLLVGALGCLAAWAVVRPTRIRWVKWPWWSFALLAAGVAVKAWLLAQARPAPEVLASVVFYIFAIGLPEEFIFRGCVEAGFADLGPIPAAVLAGLFFGATHAPLDVLKGTDLFFAVTGWLGAGVFGQFLFRWLRDRGGLAFAALVHGLLDFLGA